MAKKGPRGRLLERLDGKKVVVCMGAGGVGKTTISAALAMGMAMRGKKVAVVTIDPANRLAAALGLDELASEPHRIDESLLSGQGIELEGELWAMMLDAKRTFDQIVERLEPDEKRLAAILANPVYKELSSAVAGSHEMSAIAKLYELYEDHDFDVIVLDTPPSRNALDFLDAPGRLLGFMEGRALQLFLAPGGLTAKLFGRGTGFVFGIFAKMTGIDMMGELARFFGSIDGVVEGFGKQTKHVAALLRAPETTFLVVTSPDRAPAQEAVFLADRLHEAGMARGGVIVNRVESLSLNGMDEARLTESLLADLDERLASKVAANLADFDVLARRDAATVARLSEQLQEPDPVLVRDLDEDIHDLAGLAEVAALLLD
ncbi:MAG TPA: ArsA-related P-loop ATPase [Solirubrobacteraceae bacterium]|nr:ArsA-related P-loop ATPase [Solirubrobacteraceae bacterium]